MGNIVTRSAFLPPIPLCDAHQVPGLVWLKNDDQHNVPALWLPYDGAKRTLLFSHGNAEDITHCHDWLKNVSEELRVNVMAYEYPGYSFTTDSQGYPVAPSEALCYANCYAAYKFLTEVKQLPKTSIISFGRSLGSGSATHLAATREVGGLILMSALLSAVRVVSPVGVPAIDIFCNKDKIHKVKAPLFIMHGKSDRVIDWHHSESLFSMASKAPWKENWWIDGADHNDIYAREQDSFVKKLTAYLKKLDEDKEPATATAAENGHGSKRKKQSSSSAKPAED